MRTGRNKRALRTVVAYSLTLLALSGWAAGDEPSSKKELQASAKSIRDIIAHRGSSADRPENTLASAMRAVEARATAIEIDIRTTSDGHLIILHDAKLERTTNGSGDVGTKTLKEIRALDAGGKFEAYRGEKVPTLDEMLQLSEQQKIDLLLDLKESGEEYARKIVEAIGRSGNAKRIIVGVRSPLKRAHSANFCRSPGNWGLFLHLKTSNHSRCGRWHDSTLVKMAGR